MSVAIFQSKLRRKAAAVVAGMAQEHHEQYREDVTARQVSPVGTPLGCANGRRSCPGDYPYRDTGEGERAIGWGVDIDLVEARSGVTRDGEHLVHLSHPKSGRARRKGMDDTMRENIDAIVRAGRVAGDRAR